ncbi:alpha/beta hydrolase [Nonomuraea sp. NPDC049419]|uniref:alpha/beta hydrolase n=1 Tax=Nonomuraea sp. NPDC049419 TaxID=3155772 RepID=UPI0034205283
MSEVLVVVGPGVVADTRLLREIADREFAAQAVTGAVAFAEDPTHLQVLLGTCEAAVVLDRPTGQVTTPPVTVWVDLERTDSGEGVRRIQGRGVQGLAWGIRHAVHRMRHPGIRRVTYGTEPDQWADLYAPETRRHEDGRDGAQEPWTTTETGLPVVALIHGGYWRSIWAADLMEPLCADLLGRGFAVWNIEYRRPDLHGWDATTSDIATALSTLHDTGATGAAGLDLSRVAVVGHSAGGQLALRAAADGALVSLAVSLAGVLDLEAGDRRWLSAGAVAAALGHPSRSPLGRPPGPARADRYAESSPLRRVPLGVPQLIVQGAEDDLDLVDFSRRYAVAARAAGDDVTYLELPGGHFDVIAPTAPIWRAAVSAITDALR